MDYTPSQWRSYGPPKCLAPLVKVIRKKATFCVNGTLIITAVPSPAAKLVAMDLVQLNSGITLFMYAESSGEVYRL